VFYNEINQQSENTNNLNSISLQMIFLFQLNQETNRQHIEKSTKTNTRKFTFQPTFIHSFPGEKHAINYDNTTTYKMVSKAQQNSTCDDVILAVFDISTDHFSHRRNQRYKKIFSLLLRILLFLCVVCSGLLAIDI
jgi:hypothetical protein